MQASTENQALFYALIRKQRKTRPVIPTEMQFNGESVPPEDLYHRHGHSTLKTWPHPKTQATLTNNTACQLRPCTAASAAMNRNKRSMTPP